MVPCLFCAADYYKVPQVRRSGTFRNLNTFTGAETRACTSGANVFIGVWEMVKNQSHNWCSHNSIIDENIRAVGELLEEDRCLTVDEIAS